MLSALYRWTLSSLLPAASPHAHACTCPPPLASPRAAAIFSPPLSEAASPVAALQMFTFPLFCISFHSSLFLRLVCPSGSRRMTMLSVWASPRHSPPPPFVSSLWFADSVGPSELPALPFLLTAKLACKQGFFCTALTCPSRPSRLYPSSLLVSWLQVGFATRSSGVSNL